MTTTDRNISTLKTSTASAEARAVLLQHAQASGADLTAMKRLTITLRARMNVRIEAPLQQCISLMGDLTGAMAAPAGQQILLAPDQGVVVDASEIISMVIGPVPSK